MRSCMRACACVCVCGWNELEVCTTLAYIHVSVHSVLCQCVRKLTRTRILKPFEDSEPMGLKVDIAQTKVTPVTTVTGSVFELFYALTVK